MTLPLPQNYKEGTVSGTLQPCYLNTMLHYGTVATFFKPHVLKEVPTSRTALFFLVF